VLSANCARANNTNSYRHILPFGSIEEFRMRRIAG
jgi:hypothetical protein